MWSGLFVVTGQLVVENLMPWNHERYERFRKERLEPVYDLIKMIDVKRGLRVIDLGCGTGDITAILADSLPDSTVLGIDDSPEMLEQARPRKASGLDFRLQRIQDVTGQWDLVFSNAAIQWVPNHGELVPALMSLVAPGGQIVMQVPRGHPALGLIKELAGTEPFRDTLIGTPRPDCLPLLSYAELLHQCGAKDIVAVEKIYPHVLQDADDILAWAEGTGLVPYLDRLEGQVRQEFLDQYRRMLRERWPSKPVFFGFQRMLIAANRRDGLAEYLRTKGPRP
jgi:trans-aconitate 2-methyltransferase